MRLHILTESIIYYILRRDTSINPKGAVMMKRKLLSFAVALVMVLTLVPVLTYPAQAATPEGNFIQDIYFYELVLERIGMPYGYVITQEDAHDITYLDFTINPNEVNPRRIRSLAGIEYFTELESFRCKNHQLTTVDFSKNTKLTSIDVTDNYLTALDASNLPALKYLNCSNNRLTVLTLGGNSELESIGVENNRLTAINVTGLSNLRILGVHEN
jgi:Leucine-rich repeat (LRR) protein